MLSDSFVNTTKVNNQEVLNFASVAKNRLADLVKGLINNDLELTAEEKKEHIERFQYALNLAIEIHKNQESRVDGPYINHVLRVTIRIIEEYNIKDLNIIIAWLLHDSVEDQAENLSKNIQDNDSLSEAEKALLFLKNIFGQRVAWIVSQVSTPNLTKQLSVQEWNQFYSTHIAEIIEDPDILITKFSDFSDNALTLDTVDDTKLRLRYSMKYLPVMRIFVKRFDRSDVIFSPEKRTEIVNHLLWKIQETEIFIKSQQ